VIRGAEVSLGPGVEWPPDRRVFDLLSITPFERPDIRLARALLQAGSAVAIDCGRDESLWPELYAEFSRGGLTGAGIRFPEGVALDAFELPAQVGFLIVAGDDVDRVPPDWRSVPLIAQVCSAGEAERAFGVGVAGVIAKGAESGGRVGTESAFILLQRILDLPGAEGVPVWCQGGIGLHTAAAAFALGAFGVVLDSVLSVFPESTVPEEFKKKLLTLDGSEVRTIAGYQLYLQGLSHPESKSLADGATIRAALAGGGYAAPLAMGQDIGLAAGMARACPTIEALVTGLRLRVAGQLHQARSLRPLAEGGPWAAAHGTRYPVAQGPMTRVSDTPAFCAAVAEEGGLPFLALARLDADTCRSILEETRELLGDRPWGVGVLGFADPEVLGPQLELIEEFEPAAVIVAGGRPSQARPLIERGIPTYLHVPAPSLLKLFLEDGARHFIFEGRECGGHVGPRFSLVLWEQAVSILLELEDPENLQVLFAGGIHDSRSSAAVAVLAAPLAARGAKVGVLMGSAYLATEEVVASGALTDRFQSRALCAKETVLIEISPGHAIRCLPNEFTQLFERRKAELLASDIPPREVASALEELIRGRLRIASKGVERRGDALVSVERERQDAEGVYMMGQVAAFLESVTTIAELHASVTTGAMAHLDTIALPAHGADRPEPIAIVGMACVFPGARDLESYWSNILEARNSISEVPDHVWRSEQYFRTEGRGGDKTYSRWAGFIDDVAFDPLEYGIPPQSLSSIDPPQLLALEAAKRALEDAGYTERYFDRSRASVILGGGPGALAGDVRLRHTLPQYCGDLPPELEEVLPSVTEDTFPGILGNVIAGRIANRLGLGGLNYVVDAACASSLAAVEQAVKELRYGTSDLVLAGGADFRNNIHQFLLFSEIGAFSATGQCRAFDESADGTVIGEGVGIVVLKRLSDAERDGDRIYAVIEGIGGSSDGRGLGLTAPRKEGQKRALERAYAQAGVLPGSVGLVEAHGTGTVLGDRTELKMLTEVFNAGGALAGQIGLGSVKSQIGHTKCAAGIAGVIKVAKALHHRVLPPTTQLTTPNRGYRAGSSPFVLRTEAVPWLGESERGAVSAYGFGGTNFHAVLSAYRPHRSKFGAKVFPAELFAFRGATVGEAQQTIRQLAAHIDEATAPLSLAALAYAAWKAGEGPVQCAFVASSIEELRHRLETALERRGGLEIAYRPETPAGKVAWLYPGQGSQYPGMLRDLFVYFPSLRSSLEDNPDCARMIFPPTAFDEETREEQRRRLTNTTLAQPALCIVESALSSWLSSLGLCPDMAAGHSLGEFIALSGAGAMEPDELISLARARARTILSSITGDPGVMVAVAEDAPKVLELVRDFPEIVAANHNSPTQTVISGPTDQVLRAFEHLKAAGVLAKRIDTACAFHSPLVAAAEEETARQLEALPFSTLKWPVYSNVTASRHGSTRAELLENLKLHLVSPVRFVEMIEAMYEDGARTFVEVGPRRVLSGLVRQILADRECRVIGLDGGERGLAGTLGAVAQLAVLSDGFDAEPLFVGRTEPASLSEPPKLSPTTWLVNGAGGRPYHSRNGVDDPRVRLAEGPVVRFTGAGGDGAGGAGTSGVGVTRTPAAQEALLEYLSSMRELVRAQRDVLVSYFGGAVAQVPVVEPVGGVAGRGVDVDTERSVGEVREAARQSSNGTAELPRERATVEVAPERAANHRAILLEIVSERTGYPIELLDPDLDLEADLSIDSIKRQEIIAELSSRLGLRELVGQGIDALVEELSARKTLNSLLEWLADHLPKRTGGDDSRTAVAGGGEGPSRGGAAPGGPAAGAKADARPVAEVLLEIVSETTGYPIEVLDPDLDLEADLSIDSIKRVEIVGRLAGHPAVEAAGSDRDALLERLSRLKTLRAISEWLEPPAQSTSETRGDTGTPRSGSDPEVEARTTSPGQPAVPLHRYIVRPVPAAAPVVTTDLTGTTFLITDDGRGIAEALADRLRRRGADVRLVDFSLAGRAALLEDGAGGVDGLIHLWPLRPGAEVADIKPFFSLAQRALVGGVRYLVTVGSAITPDVLGSDGDATVPRGLGLLGLAQAAAAEFPDSRVCHLELDLRDGIEVLAGQIEQELEGARDEVAISYSDGERLVRRPFEDVRERVAGAGVRLGRESVVLFTGGARGVTARLAVELARRYRCHLEITGRSPEPEREESPRTRGVTDPRLLRQALLYGVDRPSPSEVERLVKKTLAEREIRETLAQIRAAGASVRYTQLDVRDRDALAALIADCYRRYGRIDGVVHGAGVVEPALIPAKSAESFARVFDTKVDAALTLYREIRTDPSFVVFFSSIASVTTRNGQVDYSAANSVLDRLAAAWQTRISGRVLAVNWGPWGGTGMVDDALARSYVARGIGLIPLDEGVEALLDELGYEEGETQVALICAAPESLGIVDRLADG